MKPLRPPPRTRGLSQHRQRRSGPRPMAPSAVGVADGRWIYGRHAVAAALANPARRWHHLAVLFGQESEASTLVAAAAAARRGAGEPMRVVDHDSLAAILPEGAVHQGLALAVEPLAEPDLADVLRLAAATPGRRMIVVLDQVTDPRNVGAVLRSAAAFGAFAVVLAVHGAPPVTGALAKAASGALEQVPLVRVVNLARTLDRLKQSGFWVCGLEANAQQTLADLELGDRVAVVLGSEGGGMRRLVREHCDYLARLPTRSAQATINVSSAAAIALYELARDCT
ncbi:MAG: 23S rRNA (guanosine(2251)-2'-O)-methyltransferase RlmB [Alphaproteobacteria bacterium]|nr:MAG: 23S rRNA (guanosine(2251)-2'-O)-methyltransferase RlmB [Alphaproteobacteria bacterium]